MIQEDWIDAAGYEGFYQVSNSGKVRSLDRYVKRGHNGVGGFIKPGIILNSTLTNGYPKITLSVDGIKRKIYVHQLVAKSFVHNPENKPQVNHKNGIRTDNAVENLEWCTNKENNYHANLVLRRDTFYKKGEGNIQAKLTQKQADNIREINAKFKLSNVAIGEMFSVSGPTINGILNNKRWVVK